MASTKPKNTRSTKSTSNVSKTNKKSLLGRINFRSKRIQFLTVIFSFALIGGGFMVYKSFAATPVNLYKQCLPSNCLNAKTLGINAFNGTDSQKSSIQLYRLKKDGVASTSTMTLPGDATMKYCMTVKADKNVEVSGGIGFGQRGGAWPVWVSTSWADVCTDNQGPFGATMPNAVLSLTNTSDTQVYVSKIFVLTDGAPAPQGTPSK